jgi:L,D-peptidoglycan transpeptidase YkuD (ErfK/YbiS/YcfS/YnhG family)
MPRTIALGVCALLCAAVAATVGRAQGSACPFALPNGLTSTGSATQLVTVVPPRRSATQAELRLWRKSGACWVEVAGPWTAGVGRHGINDDKREGDRTTPAGVFGFGRVMYGIGPDPGVHYPYRHVVCGDWWVEDPRSPYYNRFHHVPCDTTPPFRVTSEDMAASPTAYRHLAFIRYNANPVVPGRGSGIFLHVSTGRPTLGCVSLPLPELTKTLRWLRPASDPRIAIGTRAMIRGF